MQYLVFVLHAVSTLPTAGNAISSGPSFSFDHTLAHLDCAVPFPWLLRDRPVPGHVSPCIPCIRRKLSSRTSSPDVPSALRRSPGSSRPYCSLPSSLGCSPLQGQARRPALPTSARFA